MCALAVLPLWLGCRCKPYLSSAANMITTGNAAIEKWFQV